MVTRKTHLTLFIFVEKEVDKINEEAPVYRMIRKVILRKTDFIHNTSAKLIRMAEENKAEE